MLVLSRRQDESIVIGNEIEIRVVEIFEDRVRLAVEGPFSTHEAVHRVFEAPQHRVLSTHRRDPPVERHFG